MSPQQILTTVMTRIIVDKTIYHAKPHSICFLPQYQRNGTFVFFFFFFFHIFISIQAYIISKDKAKN